MVASFNREKEKKKDWVLEISNVGKETRPEPIVLFAIAKHTIRAEMGSTSTSSALIHHFPLTTRNLASPTKQRPPYAVNFCNSWREAGLRYSVTQRRSKGFGRVAALDDNSDDSPTPGVGSAVEDRPPGNYY